MKQRTIWKDTAFWTSSEIDDMKKQAQIMYNENYDDEKILSDDELCEEIERYNQMDYEDTLNEFSRVSTNNKIVLIADNATWQGRRKGIKLLSSKLENVMYSYFDGVLSITYDRYNIRAEEGHHDVRFCSDPTPNRYLFREVKPEYDYLSDYELCNLLIKDGEIDKQAVTRYTKSLRPYLKELWGV